MTDARLARRLGGVARTAQLFAAAPRHAASVLIFADGSDTAVANPPHAAAARLAAMVAGGEVLLGGECKSWPRCLRANYSRDAAYVSCRRTLGRAGQCYLNSGTYAAAPAQLERLVRLWRAQPSGLPAGDQSDQAQLHSLCTSAEPRTLVDPLPPLTRPEFESLL